MNELRQRSEWYRLAEALFDISGDEALLPHRKAAARRRQAVASVGMAAQEFVRDYDPKRLRVAVEFRPVLDGCGQLDRRLP